MRQRKKDLAVMIALAALLLVMAVLWPKGTTHVLPVRTLAEIQRSGQLIVLTQNNPTVYYVDRHENESGPEYKLVKDFAESIGVKPVFIIKNSVVELMDAISRGEGDLATAGLSITAERKRKVLFGPAYQTVSQQVVCRRGGERPNRISNLVDTDLVIIAGSSYEERLKELQKKHPKLSWHATTGLGSEQILESVWERKIGCTVMDSTIVSINQRYFPELRVRFALGKKDELAWALPKGANELRQEAVNWLTAYKADGKMAKWRELYYGHVTLFDYVDIQAFKRRIKERFPKYRQLFEQAAEENELSFTLLAAQAYQESHWNPKAKSPTGVRGMMMLTWPTARSLGVKNRLNAEQSIFAGAKYFAKLRDNLKDELNEPDLTWMTLAAYNVGLGHLRDAQALARRQGKDPKSWHDMKMMLPLLSQREYYSTVKYGYARGSEPVKYVQQIRQYQQVLQQVLNPADVQIFVRPRS
ncbi:Transglycosylase2C Slt family [gamma proteobacterium IMCC2047]|nr:Transglycosylase2C Slt family [gamma proteobacterium IMCC2047]